MSAGTMVSMHGHGPSAWPRCTCAALCGARALRLSASLHVLACNRGSAVLALLPRVGGQIACSPGIRAPL
eukprot:3019914-Alexandrium_andersonii.AAC.1